MASEKKKRLFDKDTLNLVIAGCAVLISAASFYAAYVQSEAAQKQVQAETWPFLQIKSSNYDQNSAKRIIDFSILNAGVGPAQVKRLDYYYDGVLVPDMPSFYKACCLQDGQKISDIRTGISNLVTGSSPPYILAVGDSALYFSSEETEENKQYWELLNRARFKITAKACYCSLLQDCFETDFVADPVPVKICKIESPVGGNS